MEGEFTFCIKEACMYKTIHTQNGGSQSISLFTLFWGMPWMKEWNKITCETTKQIMLHVVVARLMRMCMQLGKHNGSLVHSPSQFTTPLLRGQPQCLSFGPSSSQHHPSFLNGHGWKFWPLGTKRRREWHGGTQ